MLDTSSNGSHNFKKRRSQDLYLVGRCRTVNISEILDLNTGFPYKQQQPDTADNPQPSYREARREPLEERGREALL